MEGFVCDLYAFELDVMVAVDFLLPPLLTHQLRSQLHSIPRLTIPPSPSSGSTSHLMLDYE